jgi:hypothetical protein
LPPRFCSGIVKNFLLELEDQLATGQPLTLATRKSGEATRACGPQQLPAPRFLACVTLLHCDRLLSRLRDVNLVERQRHQIRLMGDNRNSRPERILEAGHPVMSENRSIYLGQSQGGPAAVPTFWDFRKAESL